MSEIIRDFDNEYNGSDPLEGIIVDLIESIHVGTPEERWVTDESVFTVAERSLIASAGQPNDVRHFNAVRDVNKFLSLASSGIVKNGEPENADLLPISHPASTAPHSLSASALRQERAKWIASDPRITDEKVRAIVASVYSSNPNSVDFEYNLIRMQMLSAEDLPTDLQLIPLVAFGDPYAGKNARAYRSARAKAQRRDRYGRFAFMGGSIQFYVKRLNGRLISAVGKVAGNSRSADGIDIELGGIPGLKDGIYTVPANITQMIQAILPEGISSKTRSISGNTETPYIDISKLIRKALPDSWAKNNTPGIVNGVEPEQADAYYGSADGYQVNQYNDATDALKKRVDDSVEKFGSEIIGTTGTDVLDPSKAVYELISSKRGQNEVVGYAQDWASVQQLASKEDEDYPEVENEPVAEVEEQEMAGKIPDKDVENIKKQVDIADVIGKYIDLEPAGSGKYIGLCPFHADTRPSLNVNSSRGTYKCFVDGESGDAIEFVRKVDNVSFPEAVRKVADIIGYRLPESTKVAPRKAKAKDEPKATVAKKIAELPEPEEAPESLGEEASPEEVFDPDKSLPEGWKKIKLKTGTVYSYKGGIYVAEHGDHRLVTQTEPRIDPETGDIVFDIDDTIAYNSLVLFRGDDESRSRRLGLGFDWNQIEEIRQADTEENGEPELGTNQQSVTVDAPLADIKKYATPDPNRKVKSDDDEPLSEQNVYRGVVSSLTGHSYTLQNLMTHHDVTDPALIDTYDEMISNPTKYTVGQARQLALEIKKFPKREEPLTFKLYPASMAEQREKVRRAINTDNGEITLTDEQKESYNQRYRTLAFPELSALLLEINAAKNLQRNAVANKAAQQAGMPRVIKNRINVKPFQAVTYARNFSSDPDLLRDIDEMLEHPEDFDFVFDGINSLLQRANKLPNKSSSDEAPSWEARSLLRQLLRDPQISQEDYDRYDNQFIADASRKEISDAIQYLKSAYPEIRAIKVTDVYDEDFSGEDPVSTGGDIVLGTELSVAQNGPSPDLIAQVQKLVNTKKIPEDELNDFLDQHPTMVAARWKLMLKKFSQYPDKTPDEIEQDRQKRAAANSKPEAKEPEVEEEPLEPTEEDTAKQERLRAAMADVADFYHNLLVNADKNKTPKAYAAAVYLMSRGFDLDDIKHYKIGYAPYQSGGANSGELYKHMKELGYTNDELKELGLISEKQRDKVYDVLQGRIVWPVKDENGQVLGLSSRIQSDDEPSYKEGKSQKWMYSKTSPIYKKMDYLYNLDNAKDKIKESGKAIFVEGYANVMALRKLGIDNVVALSGVIYSNNYHKQLMDAIGDSPLTEIALALDPDKAGRDAMEAIAKQLVDLGVTAKISVVDLPDDQDVADTYLKDKKEKTNTLVEAIKNRRELVAGSPKVEAKQKKSKKAEEPQEKVESVDGDSGPSLHQSFLDHYFPKSAHDEIRSDEIANIFEHLVTMGAPVDELFRKLPLWYVHNEEDGIVSPFWSNLVPILNEFTKYQDNSYDPRDYIEKLEELKSVVQKLDDLVKQVDPDAAGGIDDLIAYIDSIVSPSKKKSEKSKEGKEKKSQGPAETEKPQQKPDDTKAPEPEKDETPEGNLPDDKGPEVEEPKAEEPEEIEVEEIEDIEVEEPKDTLSVSESRKEAIEKAAKKARRNKDAKLFRRSIAYTLQGLIKALDDPQVKIYGLTPLVKGAISDLTSLANKMTNKNKPSAADVKRQLNLIHDGLTDSGSAHSYGKIDPSNVTAIAVAKALAIPVKALVGQYTEGETGPAKDITGFEGYEQEMASYNDKPSMRRILPPALWGPAFEPLRKSSDWDDLVDFLENIEFFVADIETTGLPDIEDPSIKNDLIQIAVAKIKGMKVQEVFKTYINPESAISPYTLRTVGDGMGGKVTKEFLEQQPTKKEALERLLEFMPADAVIAGHNVMLFDLEVINRSLRSVGLPELTPSGILDTYGLSAHVMPRWSIENPDAPFKLLENGKQYKSDRLEDLVTYFGLSNNGRHEADADVISTVEVLERMLQRAASGRSASGQQFSLDGATNNFNPEDYQNALDEYENAITLYLAYRTAQAAMMVGESDDSNQAVLDILLGRVENIKNSAGATETVDETKLPAASTVADAPAGTYVRLVSSRRIGKSYGSMNDQIIVEFPAPDFLISGKTVMELLSPNEIAPVTDRFMSSNGILIDTGMSVNIPDEEGTWVVASLHDVDRITVSKGSSRKLVSPNDTKVISDGVPSPASREQENRIVNLAGQLEAAGVIDRVLSNAYQTAAIDHFYSQETAKNIIKRLVKAKSQHILIETNKKENKPLPRAKRVTRPEIIQEMASNNKKVPVDTVKISELDKIKIDFNKLALQFTPTKEGQNILKAVAKGLDVVVQALAGTGKTTTLRMVARMIKKMFPDKNLLYIVFNKVNQEEAEIAFAEEGNTEARTSDSVSFNADVNYPLRAKRDALYDIEDTAVNAPVNLSMPSAVADFLGIPNDFEIRQGEDIVVEDGKKKKKKYAVDKKGRIATAITVVDGLNNWVVSEDDEIDFKHFKRYQKQNKGELPNNPMLLEYVQMLWEDIISPLDISSKQVLIDFNHMFKHWALTRPDLSERDDSGNSRHGLKAVPDILLLDEAQDINPVFRRLLLEQRDLHKNGIQLVTVGDSNQTIYGFRGSEDALTYIARDITLTLSQSYRSGKAITDFANRVLIVKHGIEAWKSGKLALLQPDPSKNSSIVEPGSLLGEPELMIIGRTNSGVLQAVDVAGAFYGNKPARIHEGLKQEALLLLRHLKYLRIKDAMENSDKTTGPIRPQLESEKSPILKGYITYGQVEEAKGYKTLPNRATMVMNAIAAVKKNHEFDYMSEAIDHLIKVLSRARVRNDNFSVPDEIGKEGKLGGGISYKIVDVLPEDKNTEQILVIKGNGDRPPRESVAWGITNQYSAIEDNGFVRSERDKLDSEGIVILDNKGNPRKVYEWELKLGKKNKKNIQKILTDLVYSMNGYDAAYTAMTAHTSKGLESRNVMIWPDKWPTPESKEVKDSRKAKNKDSNKSDDDDSSDWTDDEEMNLVYVAGTRAMEKLDLGPLGFYLARNMEQLANLREQYLEQLKQNIMKALAKPSKKKPVIDSDDLDQEMSSPEPSYTHATEMVGKYEDMLKSLERGETMPASIKKLDPFDPLFAEKKEAFRDVERSRILSILSKNKYLLDTAKRKDQAEG